MQFLLFLRKSALRLSIARLVMVVASIGLSFLSPFPSGAPQTFKTEFHVEIRPRVTSAFRVPLLKQSLWNPPYLIAFTQKAVRSDLHCQQCLTVFVRKLSPPDGRIGHHIKTCAGEADPHHFG